MIAISIQNGGGDAQGSERGLEYDTMSGHYAEWVENEVLPLVESKCNVTLTHDPNGPRRHGWLVRWSGLAHHGLVSPRAVTTALLAYSGTWINQQWPWNPDTPHGAWGFVDNLVPNSRANPSASGWRSATATSTTPTSMHDDMHDWVLANEKNGRRPGPPKHYHYQFVFAKNAGHVDTPANSKPSPKPRIPLARLP